MIAGTVVEGNSATTRPAGTVTTGDGPWAGTGARRAAADPGTESRYHVAMIRRALVYAGLGVATTPILDYVWHAVLGHEQIPNPTGREHKEHHRTASTVTPPWDEVRANTGRVAVIGLGVAAALGPVVGFTRSVPYAVGLLAGYVLITHGHAKMHARPPETEWERFMWRFHWHHHAVDPNVNFGLTNPALDFVFGTAVVPDSVVIPDRMAPAWLVGDVAGLRRRSEVRAA